MQCENYIFDNHYWGLGKVGFLFPGHYLKKIFFSLNTKVRDHPESARLGWSKTESDQLGELGKGELSFSVLLRSFPLGEIVFFYPHDPP